VPGHKNPSLNVTISPSLNATLNPALNSSLNPAFNPSVNPALNPQLNPALNPQENPPLTIPASGSAMLFSGTIRLTRRPCGPAARLAGPTAADPAARRTM
jgi:hypothetical protein